MEERQTHLTHVYAAWLLQAEKESEVSKNPLFFLFPFVNAINGRVKRTHPDWSREEEQHFKRGCSAKGLSLQGLKSALGPALSQGGEEADLLAQSVNASAPLAQEGSEGQTCKWSRRTGSSCPGRPGGHRLHPCLL